ncbi:MAG: PQQ-binding-like beta-propeller repeat protein [Deltaproteobacteria bacterium]|nr:PQQ-binding-like beta-propeller repeat protein [Deltaproteobacteria bacterium]
MYRDKEQAGRDLVVVAVAGRVAALDRHSGAERWRSDLPGGSWGEVAVAVTEQHVLASAAGNVLFCLDYRTGEQLWTAQTSCTGRASILVDGEQIFVARSGEIECFSSTGKRLWHSPLKGMGTGAMALGLPGGVVQADAASSG